MRDKKGRFIKGHKTNVGAHRKIKDSSKMGGVRVGGGFQKGNKLGRGKSYMLGKKHSVETRMRMRASSSRGVKSKWWKGGVTNLRKLIRGCFLYRQWRSDVFTRDNFTCVLCFARGVELNADHYPKSFALILHKNNIASLEEALICEEFWDINNGRTLCKNCHLKTPNHGKKL